MRVRTVLLVSALLSGIVASNANAEFSCDSADSAKANGGAAKCYCQGSDNCSEMRKSDSCKTAVTCGAGMGLTVCSCTAKAQISGSTLKLTPPTSKSQK